MNSIWSRMGADEMLFLSGLGVVYAVAFAVVRNVLVLWPLLVPTGSFYNNVDSGDIELPWAAILGFLDVLALMVVVVWLASRHERRTGRTHRSPPEPPTSSADHPAVALAQGRVGRRH